MSSSTHYRATYGGQPCDAHTNDGNRFTVILDKDPGHGSMIFHRIGRTMLGNLVELPGDDTDPVIALLTLIDLIADGRIDGTTWTVATKVAELTARTAA